MAYRVGFCPSCDTQIMLKNMQGQWYPKPNYAQAYLYLENESIIKVPVCKDCVNKNEHEKILAAWVADGSQAQTPKMIEYVKNAGASTRLEGRM